MKKEVIEEINGIKITDPYRWLEDSENPEVKTWIEEQNRKVDENLRDEEFEVFVAERAKNFKITNFSNPISANGKYFYSERKPDEDQSALYIKEGLSGNPIELFNPNGKREGNTLSLDYFFPSNTGKYIIYGVSEGGDEMSTLYIKNMETGDVLENIVYCRHTEVAWLPDDSGFFYNRNARPGTIPKNEEHLHGKVYLHILGQNPDDDELIFGADRDKDDMLDLFPVSPNGRYVGIRAAQKWTEDEVFVYDIQSKKLLPIGEKISARFTIKFLQEKILLLTNQKANNYHVLWATYDDFQKPIDQWKKFIAEKDFLLSSIAITSEKVLVEYLVNACSEVVVFDHAGNEQGKIPLPQYSTLIGITGRVEEKEFFYSFNTFIIPKIIYRYNPETTEYQEYQKTENPMNPDDFEVKQEWYVSKDGTKVPIFVIHKKGVVRNGVNPAILYGYGGFNVSETPGFISNWISWLQRGGVYAIANIRGGGEFGQKWHKDGIGKNKQNSFDDFIAAAEFLIDQKYTNKEHLGIMGGSNGGLLVSAVAVQRPELCKAVVSKVPLTDMVRFHKFGIAMRWVHEYGNPDKKEDLESILKWSPYYNIKNDMKYPDFFFTTANRDTRVDPLHARKMVAKLQENKDNKVFIFTEIDAGHGMGKPVAKMVENQALVLSFFAKELGLKI